jgi:UDP-glucose 4-epimerase
MRALVTGADGFIGSHLVERLLSEGHTVRAFCCYNSNGSRGWLDGLECDRLTVTLGDIRDGRQVEEACKDIDVVYHLAALIDVPYSYKAPESYIQTNVIGTLNVLEAAKRTRVLRVVITSTSEVYGTPETMPITEKHPLQAQSPYAASKIAADQLALSYWKSFGTPVVVIRPFNTYGPRQSTRAVLSSILTQLLEGKEVVELGNTGTYRDMTYVSDTAYGIMLAGTTPWINGETIQLGTGIMHTVHDMFLAACKVLGVKASVGLKADLLRPQASEVRCLLSDPTKARDVLGWSPTVYLPEGIARTAEWIGGRKILARGAA